MDRVKRRFEFSPRSWRCFYASKGVAGAGLVFSTFVEVFLTRIRQYRCQFSFLHVRGGVSKVAFIVGTDGTFSLRSWRCFWIVSVKGFERSVFSTFVEVFPNISEYPTLWISFLHVRGGVFDINCIAVFCCSRGIISYQV